MISMERLFGVMACLSLVIFSGCYTFSEGPHKLDGMFEEHPSAYQNGSNPNLNSEPLTLFVKLENRGEHSIRLAAPPKGSGELRTGLYVTARLLNPSDIFPDADLEVNRGVRAGRVLKPFAKAAQDPIFDPYNSEVRSFARLGAKYLRLNEDLALNALTINGNEALIMVRSDIDWEQVNWGDDLVKEETIQLELSFTYLDRKGEWWTLEDSVKHRMRVYLHKARRHATSTLHSGSGPAEGTFQLKPNE